jgi:eukaryotic translation initiation factor 2C
MHFASFLLGIVNDNWDYFVCRNSGNGSPVGNGSPNETDKKRMRRAFQSKTFKVEMSFAAKIPMQAIAAALRGQESENSQEALRVLDIILRQHAAKQ